MNYPISSIQPATKVRQSIFDALDEVNNTQEAIIITRNDEPTGVLLSYEAFDSLMETLDIMSDQDLVKELQRAENSTDYIPFDEFLAKNNLLVNDKSNTKYVSTRNRKGTTKSTPQTRQKKSK
jgi:antitoxin YefM